MKTLVLISLLIPTSLMSQNDFNWVTNYEKPGDDYSQSIDCDHIGNSYFVGHDARYNLILGKINPFGTLQWTYSPKKFDVNYMKASHIRVDSMGYTYILFEFNGTVYFGNDTVESKYGLHLIKLKDSVLQWDIQVSEENNAHFLATSLSGESYVASNFLNTKILGSDTLKSLGHKDVFVTRISKQGEVKWARSFGLNSSSRRDEPYGLSLDSTENINLLWAQGYSSSNGSGNAFVVRLDSTGKTLKNHKILGFDETETVIKGFTSFKNGHCQVLFQSKGTSTAVKDSSFSVGWPSYFTARFDTSVNLKQLHVITQSYTEYENLILNNITSDKNGSVISSGWAFRKTTLGGDSLNPGLFIKKYDATGKPTLLKTFATGIRGTSFTEVSDLSVVDANIYFVANISTVDTIDFDTLKFDPPLSSKHDIYVGRIGGKIDSSILVSTPVESRNIKPAVNVYPTIFENELTVNLHSDEPVKGTGMLSLLTIDGRIVYSERRNMTANMKISLPEIHSGLYLLNVQTNDHSHSTKVLKR